MSFDVKWDVTNHREEQECEEQWLLRKAFLERWKGNYPEERLICLARLFANIEFLGCTYPPEVMKEVALLSQEIAKSYSEKKKTKLQRTFVSASDAAEDRAKGIQRERGIIKNILQVKSNPIKFVKPEVMQPEEYDSDVDIVDPEDVLAAMKELQKKIRNQPTPVSFESTYLKDLLTLKCADVNRFKDGMFQTYFGKMVLVIRPWISRLANIRASCHACHMQLESIYKNKRLLLSIKGRILAEACGDTKQEARTEIEMLAWNALMTKVISVLVKEQPCEETGGIQREEDRFGTPIEGDAANKILKLIGRKGGGGNVGSLGIEELNKTNLQMINRADLGRPSSGMRELQLQAGTLVRRFARSMTYDVDLVFSTDFTKDERAVLHQAAQKVGLATQSYGSAADRFLVIKKRLDPFGTVIAAVDGGGNTDKYRVFIPAELDRCRK